MLGEHSVLEKFVEDILMELMVERVMSVGIQTSLIGGLQVSPSTVCHSRWTAIEK
jgi:hypothetical protein